MGRPSEATSKRLFAGSGNACAFPKCTQPLIHLGKVTGRVCHIKAASIGGPRYDATQSEEERHGFGNLVLMCPAHHDVIDADDVAYTVERLTDIKTHHEARHASGVAPTDEIAQQLTSNLFATTISNGSVIVTQNQSGGQVAHIINNLGPQKRVVSPETQNRMRSVLAQLPPARIGFASTQGDVEAHKFKLQLLEVFRSAGWQVDDMPSFMFFGSRTGLVITIPFKADEGGAPQVVASALSQTGNPVSGNRGDMATECGLYVQVWHAP